jgi:hypothetical protein
MPRDFFFLVARPPAVEDGGIPVVGAANGQLRWFGAKARGPCTAASSTRESGLPFSTCVPKSGSTRHLVRSTKQRKHTQVPSLQLMPPSGRACPTCAVSLLVRHAKKRTEVVVRSMLQCLQSYPSRRGQKITGKRFSSTHLSDQDEDDNGETLIVTLKERERERDCHILNEKNSRRPTNPLNAKILLME